MKYTIEGFNQKTLIEYGLNATDACILRYVVDFWHTGKMTKVVHEGKDFLWIKYDAVIEALPCIEIESKIALARRFKKYVDCGLMEHYTHKEGGTFSCYRFTEKYDPLIEKFEGVKLKSETPLNSEVRTKDSSINNSSIKKDIYIDLLHYWNTKKIIVHGEEIIRKNIKKKHKDDIKFYGEDIIKQAIDNYSEVLESDQYYWSYRWGFLDFIDKGVEKFKTEARPLDNFLKNGKEKIRAETSEPVDKWAEFRDD